ncbi:AAA family ATPase [Halorubellus sp. JP-L1]|uniref:AAA family ATPase n=1 Tax=Halorubellus sp. JP-L1 TaxID=2715753 RepID=UPI001408F0E0|nr:AAA family ATPase [Halorubellus sp. JP-L1]NHN43119.1 AAA family ATPase [Halorubellus sp. JP-L1]
MTVVDEVRIQNFRSIIDSEWVSLEDGVTTLVGPNEAGKTAILEALRRFEPNKGFNEDDVCDYVSSPDLENTAMVSIRLSGVTPASSSSRHTASFNQPDLLKIDREIDITIYKYFDGSYSVESADIESEITQYESSRQERSQNLHKDLKSLASSMLDELSEEDIGESQKEIESIATQSGNSGSIYSSFRSTDKVDIGGLQNQYQTLKGILVSARSDDLPSPLTSQAMELERKISSSRPAGDLFADHFFSTVLYQNPPIIDDSIKLDKVGQKEELLYSSLLEFIGIGPDEVEGMDPRERRSTIESAMSEFTSLFTKFWTQGEIRFDLDFVNGKATLLISDESEEEQYVSQRSRGFKEFLTFFLRLLTNNGGESFSNQVILLDDPGIHLHPERQKDLIEAISNLSDFNQILYSTHSPYMLDKSHINGLRVISSKNGHEGTIIESNLTKARELDGDSLEPVRGALGATFSDSLFGSNQTILVEGYTDRVYLRRFANIFQNSGRVEFAQDAGIVDMGGGAKWEKYTRFLESEGYDYVLLLDYDGVEDNSDRRIEEDDYLDKEDVIRIDSILDKTISEGDKVEIEDVFDREDFLRFVCDVYEDVSRGDFEMVGEGKQSIVEDVNIRFQKLRGQQGRDIPDFRKREIADYIDMQLKKHDVGEVLTEKSVENFTQLVNDINTSLPQSIRTKS